MLKLKPLIVLAVLLVGATGVAFAAERQVPSPASDAPAVTDV